MNAPMGWEQASDYALKRVIGSVAWGHAANGAYCARQLARLAFLSDPDLVDDDREREPLVTVMNKGTADNAWFLELDRAYRAKLIDGRWYATTA